MKRQGGHWWRVSTMSLPRNNRQRSICCKDYWRTRKLHIVSSETPKMSITRYTSTTQRWMPPFSSMIPTWRQCASHNSGTSSWKRENDLHSLAIAFHQSFAPYTFISLSPRPFPGSTQRWSLPFALSGQFPLHSCFSTALIVSFPSSPILPFLWNTHQWSCLCQVASPFQSSPSRPSSPVSPRARFLWWTVRHRLADALQTSGLLAVVFYSWRAWRTRRKAGECGKSHCSARHACGADWLHRESCDR